MAKKASKYTKKELEVLNKVKTKKKAVKKPSCIACGGTGKSSRGGPCYPCSIKKAK